MKKLSVKVIGGGGLVIGVLVVLIKNQKYKSQF